MTFLIEGGLQKVVCKGDLTNGRERGLERPVEKYIEEN